jgi:hypothetical protein
MSIPRSIVPRLGHAPQSTPEPVTLSPAGDALSWPSLNVDVYVPGLVERGFGTLIRRIDRTPWRTPRIPKAKTAAAKTNGAKGGRPRSG